MSAALIPAPPTGLQTWPEWGEAVALRLREAPTEELPVARDAIGRMHRIAQELGDSAAIAVTSVADQRVKREIADRHPPNPGGSGTSPGSVDRSTESVPDGTVRTWRADHRNLSDNGFERTAAAAVEQERPLDRATVREAGRVEKAGGDPAEAVRKPHVAHATGTPEWNTPAPILEAARFAMDVAQFDLDPASNPAAQKIVQARRYFTATTDGLKSEWSLAQDDPGSDDWGGSDANVEREPITVWLNPPYDAGLCAGFAARLLTELDAGTVRAAVWLSNNATETKWAAGLLRAAEFVCFPTGRVRFLDSDMVERLAPLQGQMILGFGDVPRFREAFEPRGPVL